MSEFPTAPVARLIEKGGASRVSEDAKEYMVKVLEERGIEISKKAKEIALSDNRKTIRSDDIKKAVESISEKD
ncbi:MAG: Histones H3 and H4 [Candidatus Methanohalarchaeum thermophilum]|uniref:Histones H3 and H4 n=1 Tax=Methanohalarchaeum thermophilum TaxID=1903181 RepID=A0A1Q6DUK2_METT1|nr:MAG: Histones H3 and H4 [Candidatus Methanohalarchaeum thermophilum]